MKVNGINNLLIKVKSVFNRNKISMSTPNINGISVPEFDELSKENQELVLTLIKDIDIDNHESTVKYSEDLAKRTDKYLSILYKVMSEMDESFVFLQKVKEAWAQKKTVNYQLIANRMGDISLLENEAELLIREIAWNDMIATMKTVAFKEFMKNESKKRNIFTMLSKAERMKYHDNNNRLLSEYNRLLNSIYIIRCNMNAASMVSNVTFYNSIIKEMIPGTFGTYHNWYIDEKREKLNKLNDIFGNEKILPPSESELSYESYPGWSMNGFGMLEYNGYVYKTIIKKMAKYKLELDKLGYEHRMDYKDIIERIKEACSRYRGKGSWRWDLDQLEKDKTTFDKIVNDYLSACGKFINDGMKEELIDAWSELLSYYKCISSHNYHEPGYSWDNYDRNKIYNDKLGKILDELVSRGVQIKKDKGSWDDLILSLSIRDSAHYIYDVYFDDLNPQDTNLYGTNTSSNSVVTEIAEDSTAFFKDAMYFKIRRLIYDNALGKAGCYFEKSISVEDLYYVLRNIGMDDEYINYELFKYRYSSWHGRDEKSKELLVKYQFNKLKAQYDDRIMIMPHKFHIEDNEEKYYLRHHRMNGKNLKAIFISDWEQLYFMKKNMSKFNLTRYLFIKESVLNHPYSSYEYTKKGIEEYGIKVIAVPDDIKYCELSSLLDNELALEENSDNIVLEQKVS